METLEVKIDNLSDLQVASIKRIIERCKHAHFTDIHIRINGKWEKEQGDWIQHMEITGEIK